VTYYEAAMAVGYEVAGVRSELIVKGYGRSRRMAKKDGYRKAMSQIKRLVAPDRYRVLYSFPVAFLEAPVEEDF